MKKHIYTNSAVIRCATTKKNDGIELRPRWRDGEPHSADEPFILNYDEAEKLYQTLFKLRKAGMAENKT